MPDFGAPVAQNVQTGDFTKTLSGLMGLQQQKQQLQAGALGIEQQQQNLQRSAAETQMTQQSAQQRAAIAGLDWSKYDDGTGTVSTDKMLADHDLQKSTGDSFLDVVKTGAAIRNQQLQNKQALVNLNDGLRNQFGSVIGALRTDPDVIKDSPVGRQKVRDAIAQFGEAGGPDAARVAQIYGPVVDHAPQGKLLRGISAIQLQAMDASRQAGAQAPSYANTGGALTNVNPQAAGGNLSGSPDIRTSIAPGAQTFQDQAGNVWAFNPQDPGHAILVGHGGAMSGSGSGAPAPSSSSGSNAQGGMPPQPGQPGGAPDERLSILREELKRAQSDLPSLSGDALTRRQSDVAALQREIQRLPGGAAPASTSGHISSPMPPNLNVGEADQVHANTKVVTENRQQAQDAQLQHDILGRIQALSSTPGLYLGPGSQHVANLATMVSQIPGFEGAAKYANNYNELTKFMAQNAARQGAALGLAGSDSRLAMAQHANPNADPMDPRTVQNVAQYMGGVVRMSLAKADAMDNWLKQPGHSLQNEHEFEKVWRDNADPRLFQLAEMKDQGEAQNYAKLHIRPSEQKALQQKHDVLHQLGVF